MSTTKQHNLTEEIEKAVRYIRCGGLVAFPTESFYGLAVDPFLPESVERLFRVKRRSSTNPLLLLIENRKYLDQVVSSIPEEYEKMIELFWPGPLTLIFPAHPALDQRLTGGTGTIGVRVSPHPVATGLVKRFGGPVTATSANRSGDNPALQAADVADSFHGDVDFILDGGPTRGGSGSTVAAVIDGRLKIFREGEISGAYLSSILTA